MSKPINKVGYLINQLEAAYLKYKNKTDTWKDANVLISEREEKIYISYFDVKACLAFEAISFFCEEADFKLETVYHKNVLDIVKVLEPYHQAEKFRSLIS